MNHSHTSLKEHGHSVRPAVNAHEKTHTNTCTHTYMHVQSNVMCRDRLSTLLRGCSRVKLPSMLGPQHASIWLANKFKLKITNLKFLMLANPPAFPTTLKSLVKRWR